MLGSFTVPAGRWRNVVKFKGCKSMHNVFKNVHKNYVFKLLNLKGGGDLIHKNCVFKLNLKGPQTVIQ